MPSPNIQFYQIPSGIRTPGAYFEFNSLLAVNSLPANVYTVMIVAQMLAAATGISSSPALEIGSTPQNVANGAFNFSIAGVPYSKAAVAAGTAIGAETIPVNTWGLWLLSIAANGTVTLTPAAENAYGYPTEALAIAAMPALPASSAAMGYITVMSTAVGGFVAGTTSLAANGVTANFYNAQIASSGSATPGVPVQVFSDAMAAQYFGNGSQAHRMVRAALKANPTLTLFVCPILDAAVGEPLAATGTITLTGAPTASGTLTVFIDNDMLQVGISLTDTPTSIAENLGDVLATRPDLPVSYEVADGLVTLTAKNKGTVGNQIQINASVTGTGITATVAAMTGGAVDPAANIAAALAVCFPGNYSLYATPYNDETNLQALRTQVEGVSAYNQQRGATAVYAFTGSLSGATTLAGETNDGRICGPYLPGTFSAAFEVAAAMAAVMASSTDPAMPLNTLPLPGIGAPPQADWLTQTEVEALLWNGVTPLCVDADGNVAIVRAISTYTTNSSGIADPSLLDITTIRTLDYVRLACRTRYLLRFPRAKLTPKMPARVRTMLLTVLKDLEDLEIVENVDANAPGLIVEQDSQSVTQLDAKIPANVVPGLHVFAGRIDLLL